MATYTPFGILLAIELGLLFCSVILAGYHAKLIEEQKQITHWVWALVYCALVGFTLLFWRLPWWFGALQLIGHLPAFNLSLDAFRGLSWRYVSSTTGSVIDRLIGPYLPWIELLCAVLFISAQFFLL